MAAAKKADEIAWKNACEQNTPSAYQAYLDGNTVKRHAEKVQQAIEECRDETAWQEACQEDTEAAFQRYLEGETLKKHAGEIKPRLQAIEVDKKAWEKACQQNTQAAYQAYLEGNTVKKYADEAKKRRLLSLSLFNPFDHLRLLWWTLVMPQQLIAHREIYGDEEQKRVGKWLVSTLIWLPLLMPTLGLGLELLPHSSKAWSADTYLLWSGGVFVCWLLTGLLGGIDNDAAVGVAVGVVVGVAGSVAFVVAFVVAVVVAAVVAGGVAVGVAGVAVVVAVGVAVVVKKSLKTGTPSWIARFAFRLLIAAHLFLIGFCFLGGWRLFA
jgi:hypothetical protein